MAIKQPVSPVTFGQRGVLSSEDRQQPADEGFIRLLVDSISDYAIYLLDPSGVILSWNRGGEVIKGYRPEEVIGRDFSMFYTADDRRAGRPQRNLAMATEHGRVEDEGWRLRKDGSRFWADVVLTALRGPSGELTGFAKVTRDLTDRREAAARERELLVEREARAKAEEAIRQRDRFLSIASHELKTPVASLQIVTDALLRSHEIGTLNAERLTASLRRIDRASQRLASLLAELLDVSRLANGQDELAVRQMDLADVLRDVIERFQPIEGPPRVQLVAEPVTIQGDPVRLDQVFANLVDNAVKYSPASSPVRVSLRRTTRGVEVNVHDVGIGLAMPERQQLFEPFGRGTNVEDVPGLGLGLFIARQIVERHGGTITAQSDGRGRGSIFRVTLPFRPPQNGVTRDG